MSSWKRDFASGLIVILPVLVSAYVIAYLYGIVSQVTPEFVDAELLQEFNVPETYVSAIQQPIQVFLVLMVFLVLVLAVGYLMRTTAGGLFEGVIDDVANRVPGLRVVYNASKMAAETALGGTDSLQTPVKIEPWSGMRMTAFKTGKSTDDGRVVLFLPTAPNITTGFVIEVHPEDITETDENVEDALTRILSAGFGDSETMGGTVDIEDLTGRSDDEAET
ncbi:DUF502 domain-containing protein [Halorubellus sp. JP-L1]|uniref:DUF502 domain-containing protein n=1 Tax=Halorubellus sp. JP-L1 TaxID=2715753 RepID=UPI0014093C52|nr:DUF502 domain-containing protein [Halorubellus sp. JP-L1]NHN41901.1 DUF502 domain-containing protein [Halorubellus sp. JP-L1]